MASIGPIKFTRASAHQSSSVVSMNGVVVARPPLNTATSTRPKRSSKMSIPARMAPELDMSKGTARAGTSGVSSLVASRSARSRDT